MRATPPPDRPASMDDLAGAELEGRVDLGDGCWLRHDPGWLPTGRADALLGQLRTSLEWEQRTIMMFGREVMQPRLVAWAGELPYRYSGRTLPPKPAPPELALAMARVSDATGHAFNHVLANRYRDGRDSMGFHSDDEPELGSNPLVASLSLGAPRRFVFVAKQAPKRRRAIVLGHGALLVMGGRFQHAYRHGVPKTSVEAPEPDCTERLSLTFRRVLRAPK